MTWLDTWQVNVRVQIQAVLSPKLTSRAHLACVVLGVNCFETGGLEEYQLNAKPRLRCFYMVSRLIPRTASVGYVSLLSLYKGEHWGSEVCPRSHGAK